MAGAAHGGAETAFADMCLALHEAGATIEVATRPDSPPRLTRLEQAGIKVHTLRFGGIFDFTTTANLRNIIRGFQPAIVQTWMSRASWKTPRWQPGMKIPRYLVVSRLGGYYNLRYFRQTDYFTTITPDIARYLTDNGIAPDRVRHINNFAETESNAAPVSRAALGTPDDAPLLLFLGRLHRAKAVDTLLRAVAQAPGVWLWIAGEGPERTALTALCHELGLDGRVRFLGWRDDRAALFQAADICVFPSRYEPFGTVFVQAWAQKRPLITTAADGPRQYVRDGEDGLVVPVDDGQALAAAITGLSADRALQARLSDRGHQRYLTEFTKENTVRSYLDFYGEILKKENC